MADAVTAKTAKQPASTLAQGKPGSAATPMTAMVGQPGVSQLQRLAGNRAVSQSMQVARTGGMPDNLPPLVQSVIRSSGRPLEPEVRSEMESRFNHDFGDVRIHTGEQAAQSAQSANADAYTIKNHIAFDTGKYVPGSQTGKRLLAHELAHVVQHANVGTEALGEHAAEFEADRVSEQVTLGNSVDVKGSVAPSMPMFQRKPELPAGLPNLSPQVTQGGSTDSVMVAGLEVAKIRSVGGESLKRKGGISGFWQPLQKPYSRNGNSVSLRYVVTLRYENDGVASEVVSGGRKAFENRFPSAELSIQAVASQPSASKTRRQSDQAEEGLVSFLGPDGKKITLTREEFNQLASKLIKNIEVELKRIEGIAEIDAQTHKEHLEKGGVIGAFRKGVDWVVNADPPPMSIWSAPASPIAKAREALKSKNLKLAGEMLQKAQWELLQAQAHWSAYMFDVEVGGGKTLEYLQNVKTTTDYGLMGLSLFAGPAGLAISMGKSVTEEIGVAGLKASAGEKVDWAQIGIKVVINAVLTLAFQKLGSSKFAHKVFGTVAKDPSLRNVSKEALKGAVLGVLEAQLNASVNEAVKTARSNKEDISIDEILHRAWNKFITLDINTLIASVAGALGGAMSARAAGNSKTPEVDPTPSASSQPSGSPPTRKRQNKTDTAESGTKSPPTALPQRIGKPPTRKPSSKAAGTRNTNADAPNNVFPLSSANRPRGVPTRLKPGKQRKVSELESGKGTQTTDADNVSDTVSDISPTNQKSEPKGELLKFPSKKDRPKGTRSQLKRPSQEPVTRLDSRRNPKKEPPTSPKSAEKPVEQTLDAVVGDTVGGRPVPNSSSRSPSRVDLTLASANKKASKNAKIVPSTGKGKSQNSAKNMAGDGKSNAPLSNLKKTPGTYANIPKGRTVFREGPDAKFTPRQKEKIREVNRNNNGSKLKSDVEIDPFQDLREPKKTESAGVSAEKGKKTEPVDLDSAEVDHIIPKALGGSNRYDNAQVVSSFFNRLKRDHPGKTWTPKEISQKLVEKYKKQLLEYPDYFQSETASKIRTYLEKHAPELLSEVFK